MFLLEKIMLHREEVVKFYANLKVLDEWVISSSIRGVDIILDPIQLGEVLRILSEGLE